MKIRDTFDKSIRPVRVVSTRLFGKKVLSDFRWESYTDFDYGPQLASILAGGETLILTESQRQKFFDLDFSDGINGVLAPHFSLYKACITLQPSSILEVGAGAGYHLVNLSKLLPGTDMRGVDLLQTQVNLGKEIFPENRDVIERIAIGNFAKRVLPVHLRLQSDLVFCQAVTMHIPLRSAKRMIENMISVSRKHVLLIENISITHDYEKLLNQIQKEIGGFTYAIMQIRDHPFGIVTITKN